MLPVERPEARHVYHLFTVRHAQRDAFVKALADLGVGTAVHYPLPVPGQPVFGGGGERRFPEAWRAAREVCSLPCFAELTDAELERVAAAVSYAPMDGPIQAQGYRAIFDSRQLPGEIVDVLVVRVPPSSRVVAVVVSVSTCWRPPMIR